VSTLIGFPAAQGLFQGAVVQSGNAALLNEADDASDLAERLLTILEIPPSQAPKLYDVPARQLLEAQVEAVGAQQRERPSPLPFSPIVDGAVITEHPLTVAPAAGVAVMGGTTRDEYGLFNLVDPAIAGLSRERLVSRVNKRIAVVHQPGTAEVLVAAYEQARGDRGESIEPSALWVAIETDRQMRYPILRMLDRYASLGVPAFGYTFGWESPYQDGLLGSSHTLELPFIFGTYGLPSVAPYAGTGTRADAVAANVQQAWTSFASKGIPALPSEPWPTIGDDGRPVAVISDTTWTQDEADRRELLAWDGLRGAVKVTGLC
jgi:para-nitrobenzyl esterase